VLVVLGGEDALNWISLRNVPRVHLLEAGQLNTYDVVNADEVVFTEDALAEFVAGPQRGRSRVAEPDLTTPDIPGAIPSIEGVGTTDLDLGETPADPAPATRTGSTAAPAVTAADAAPSTAAEAAKAPAEQAEVADAGPDATAPTEDGTTSASTETASTEEKA
jgi:large subunit ribosomal protein L4